MCTRFSFHEEIAIQSFFFIHPASYMGITFILHVYMYKTNIKRYHKASLCTLALANDLDLLTFFQIDYFNFYIMSLNL